MHSKWSTKNSNNRAKLKIYSFKKRPYKEDYNRTIWKHRIDIGVLGLERAAVTTSAEFGRGRSRGFHSPNKTFQ